MNGLRALARKEFLGYWRHHIGPRKVRRGPLLRVRCRGSLFHGSTFPALVQQFMEEVNRKMPRLPNPTESVSKISDAREMTGSI
jgi:hypothetical protein